MVGVAQDARRITVRISRVVGWVLLLVLSVALPLAAKDEDDIEKVVAAVIEAFRTGDYTAMGQHYAPDCVVVSGDYRPPIVGWEKVSRLYQAQHKQLSGAEMLRENTLIKRNGNTAWATYQWKFVVITSTGTYGFQGHTTLVLEKRRRRWLIVHNHTSALIPTSSPPPRF